MANQEIAKKKKTSVIQNITETSRKILEDYTDDGAKLDLEDINAIVRKIELFLDETQGRTFWTEDDVHKILGRLVVRRNPKSFETCIRQNAFRHTAEKLSGKGKHLITCPEVKVPKRSRRYLIYESDDYILKNVPLIQALHDDLLQLKPFKPERRGDKQLPEGVTAEVALLKEREMEYLCSFVAAAAIFGKVLFDDFHLNLLKLKCKDVFLNVCYFNVSYSDTNALRRFILPYPASAYFMRCITFYRDNAIQLGMNPLDDPENNVFNVEGLIKDFATNFKQWTAKRLRKLGHDCGNGLTTYEFRAAVKRASYGELANAIEYPPFLIAILSNADGIKSHSYGNCHFPYLADITAEYHDYEEKRKNYFEERVSLARKEQKAAAGTLPEVLAAIAQARRKLNETGMQAKNTRTAVIDEMFKVLETSDLEPWSADYQNIYLYLHWFDDMVMHSSIKFSSMNTYASQVPRLLYQLSGLGSINSLTLATLVENISQTMYLYNSKGIKKAIKSFCDYLLSMNCKQFGEIKWRSKFLAKKNTPSMKSFIPFEDLEKALVEAATFIPSYARSLKDTNKMKGLKVAVAEHKAKIYRMLIALGYYAGMRVSEIIKLKIDDVKSDQYLIITKSKTKSGKRNIYLKPLLPEDIYKELMTYIDGRRREAKSKKEFLFVQRSGNAWLNNQVSEDVARLFHYLGYRNFRFHHLRHAFANIFVFRWLHSFYASEKVPHNAPIFKHELFNEEKKVQFKQLLFGMAADANTGADEINFVIYALSKIIGHFSPKVTLQEYGHFGDVIFHLWSRGGYDDVLIRLDKDIIKDFMGQIPKVLNDYFKTLLHEDSMTGRQFYNIQKAILKTLPWTSGKNKVDLTYNLY